MDKKFLNKQINERVLEHIAGGGGDKAKIDKPKKIKEPRTRI